MYFEILPSESFKLLGRESIRAEMYPGFLQTSLMENFATIVHF